MESRLVWCLIFINTPLFDGMSGKGTVWVVPLAQHERPRLTTSNRYMRKKEGSISIKESGGPAPSSFHLPHTTVGCSGVYPFM